MNAPILTFFGNRSGVGKTSLVFHLAWMLSETGERVLACDLDPQAKLTATFLSESSLEALWANDAGNGTVFQCLQPSTETGGIYTPQVRRISESIGLIPGDLALSGFEDSLSCHWSRALDRSSSHRPFRILTVLWQIMRSGAASIDATVVLVDVGPGLGALNRSVLIATDHVIVPLGADLFSLQGLKILGLTMTAWRDEWSRCRDNGARPEFPLPHGAMKLAGYTVQQPGVRLTRPIRTCDKWVNRMPAAYHHHLLRCDRGPFPNKPSNDENCLATVRHYRSLVPLAREARKPIFRLTVADGATGSHAAAVSQAYRDYRNFSETIRERIGLAT